MILTAILALFGVGLIVGAISGLVGIGGGVLIVPFLYLFYGNPNWSGTSLAPDLAAPVAHATSLFIIVPTAVRGVIAYHRSGNIVWRAVIPIGLAAILAAVLGARVAINLPGRLLEIAFGVLLIGSAIQMARGLGRRHDQVRRVTPLRTILTGLVVGFLSALLGVGGGAIAIPMLIYVLGLKVRELAATSLAIIMFAALAGTLTYMMSPTPPTGLPTGNIGYVHLLAALPILAGSLLAVGWGTRLNQRLSTNKLRWIFAILFGVLGVELIVENVIELL